MPNHAAGFWQVRVRSVKQVRAGPQPKGIARFLAGHSPRLSINCVKSSKLRNQKLKCSRPSIEFVSYSNQHISTFKHS